MKERGRWEWDALRYEAHEAQVIELLAIIYGKSNF